MDTLDSVVAPGTTPSQRLLVAEDHVSVLARLYATVDRIHSAEDEPSLLATVREVLADLVGSEDIALLETEGPDWRRIDHWSESSAPDIPSQVLSAARTTGRIHLGAEARWSPGPLPDARAACVPLVHRGVVTGVLVVCSLLPHKLGFDASDREVLDAVSRHLGSALHALRRGAAEAGGRA